MEHGREVYLEEKVTLKDRLIKGKNWVGDNKERLFLMGLSGAAVLTYITYHTFEGKSYDGFGDSKFATKTEPIVKGSVNNGN